MRAWAIIGFAFAFGFAGQGVGSARADEASCAALTSLKIDDVNLLSAVPVAAAGDLPAYCRVLGFVRPAINFEVRLPLAGWNGKFYMAGCGGFCGKLLSDAPGFTNAMNYGLRRNYAVATMDSGHWGSSVADGRWATNNPVAEMDWGQRAVTETARAAKIVVKAHYGTEQKKAYFAGCSTGGRMAAMEALKFPKDFDGVISGAPALDYTGLVATTFAWATKANLDKDGKPIFPQSKVKLLGDAVLAKCDGADGVKDGLISDPRRCDFKPASLQCKGADGADCLTAAEVGVVEKWYGGPVDGKGVSLFPGGVPLGSEPNWPLWLTGRGAAPPILPLFGRDFLRYMAFPEDPGPSYQVAQFDFDKDPARLAQMAAVYNVTTFDPKTPESLPGGDLSAFRQAGGKLIFYHGWGDPLVMPYLTVRYYEAIAKAAGGMDKAREFARLFMAPGMDHCGINRDGPGIADTGIDPLTALERWAEDGVAPDTLTATKTTAAGAVQWSRPLCAWPQVTKYKGAGDLNDPASFECAAP